MFTGIVDRRAAVREIRQTPAGRRVVLAMGGESWGESWEDLSVGQSVSTNGVCLTVAAIEGSMRSGARVSFDVVPETLSKTNLGRLAVGDVVHIERSLRAIDRIDGHFVQGHVDGPAVLVGRSDGPTGWRMTLEVGAELGRYVSPKGSVTLDGVSLTVASRQEAEVEGVRFDVALIPTTLEKTTFGGRAVGWSFNFEADVLAKTVVDWLERRCDRFAGRPTL